MSHVGPNFESKFRPLLLNVKFSDRHQITRKRSNIISKGKTIDRKFRCIDTLIFVLYVTYTGSVLIHVLYVTYTGCMLHIRALC
jgi:hypothetical protein